MMMAMQAVSAPRAAQARAAIRASDRLPQRACAYGYPAWFQTDTGLVSTRYVALAGPAIPSPC
jgi:hypothetical protein